MASSWHLLKGAELHMDAVRLGAALYGQQRIVPGTRPAARWLTRIVRIKKARPSPQVSSREQQAGPRHAPAALCRWKSRAQESCKVMRPAARWRARIVCAAWRAAARG